jgi:hypothetical protein
MKKTIISIFPLFMSNLVYVQSGYRDRLKLQLTTSGDAQEIFRIERKELFF